MRAAMWSEDDHALIEPQNARPNYERRTSPYHQRALRPACGRVNPPGAKHELRHIAYSLVQAAEEAIEKRQDKESSGRKMNRGPG